MKKTISFALMAMLLAGCATTEGTTTTTPADEPTPSATVTTVANGEGEFVDTYTSASSTKATLSGDELTAAYDALLAVNGDCATLAQTQQEGYEASDSAMAQIMSVNPDGSVGLSTIHAWQLSVNEDGTATMKTVLTDGQNARNLAEIGKRGSILIKANEKYYLLHLETTDVVKLDYSDEAYEAGEFNSAYSGAANQLCEYTITYDVFTVEAYNLLILE